MVLVIIGGGLGGMLQGGLGVAATLSVWRILSPLPFPASQAIGASGQTQGCFTGTIATDITSPIECQDLTGRTVSTVSFSPMALVTAISVDSLGLPRADNAR